jgi:hypothetical protein
LDLSALIQHVELYQYFYEYRAMQLVTVAIFCQRLGFAFKNVEAPWTYEDFEMVAEALQDYMSVMVPELGYYYSFAISAALVFIFVLTYEAPCTTPFRPIANSSSACFARVLLRSRAPSLTGTRCRR